MDAVQIYKLMHLVGLMVLFMGLGAMFFSPRSASGRLSTLGMGLHGVGALMMLVAGFGMHARLQAPWSGWLIAKVVIWVIIGALPFAVRRKMVPTGFAWLVALLLGATAVWLVVARPF